MQRLLKNLRPSLAVVSLLLLLTACDTPAPPVTVSGATMGTYYRVVAYCEHQTASTDNLQPPLEQRLQQINDSMSNYIASSELNQLNQLPPRQWWPISAELLAVLEVAQQVFERSQGAFDVSAGPLSRAWGFGPQASNDLPPTAAQLVTLGEIVGLQHLEIDQANSRVRKRVHLELDLSALAKGYGVDQLSDKLAELGCPDHLVDIGGEVRGSGSKPGNQAWQVGIEVPDPQQLGAIAQVLPLDNSAVATSGDYRNFIDRAGERWSHTINPLTGRPVEHQIASVTVVHPSAMWADAWATALTVMGPDAAMTLASELALPVLIILHDPNNKVRERNANIGFQHRYTAPMQRLLFAEP